MTLARGLCLVVAGACALWGQEGWLPGVTDGKLRLSVESRVRFEDREGLSFGKDVDRNYTLFRNRLGLTYTPAAWLKISGMAQDARAPGYGHGAPNSVRDSVDLQEGYVELFPGAKKGFHFVAGRGMFNYGEARLIGSPQWSNVSRTFDNARAGYAWGRLKMEALLVSVVKVRQLEFNKPVLGDRVWGTYNALERLPRKSAAEFYVLRHDQNRPGGFTGGSQAAGTDRLGTNTFGYRWFGPLGRGWKYSVENAWQTGKIGAAEQRAMAWFSSVSRRYALGKRTLDVTAEHKYASGTENPKDTRHSGTFDQLYPANHDKFGHEDLIGWRNIHNARGLGTLGLTKALALNVMYDSYWLASAADALYSGSGAVVFRPGDTSAGHHVGQEADVFATWKLGHCLFGGGYGYFFNGGVVQKWTPNAAPGYAYVFTTYSF